MVFDNDVQSVCLFSVVGDDTTASGNTSSSMFCAQHGEFAAENFSCENITSPAAVELLQRTRQSRTCIYLLERAGINGAGSSKGAGERRPLSVSRGHWKQLSNACRNLCAAIFHVCKNVRLAP